MQQFKCKQSLGVLKLNRKLNIKMKTLRTLYANVSERYMYIFHLKNPAAFNDDFWYLFIKIWVNGFSVLVQFAWQFRAPRQPLGFYICSGTDLREPFKIRLRDSLLYNILLVTS